MGLARQGATVVIGDLAETSTLIANFGNPAMAAPLDISNPAVFESATWDDLDFDLWQRIMAVNLNGPMLMCKSFLPLMRGRG